MELAAADLHVGVQVELADLALDLAAERERPEGVGARHARGQQAEHATELRSAHVEGELGLRLIGTDALEVAAELALGAAEIVDAELAERQVAVLQRTGYPHLADRLPSQDQGIDAGIEVRIEADERVRERLQDGDAGEPGRRARGNLRGAARPVSAGGRRRLRRVAGDIGVQIELIDGDPGAEREPVPYRNGSSARQMRRIEREVERAHLHDAVVDFEAARYGGTAQAIGRYTLRRHAAPTEEVAKIVGIRAHGPDEAGHCRHGIQGPDDRNVRPAGEQRAETLDVDLAALERRLEAHLLHQVLSPGHAVDGEIHCR